MAEEKVQGTVVEEVKAEEVKGKVKGKGKGKGGKAKAKATGTGIQINGVKGGVVTVKDLEGHFGLKAKVIRRYLRKMGESTKPRGPQRYEWDLTSTELAAIYQNLDKVAKAGK